MIVVDASVTIKAFLPEEGSDEAIALLRTEACCAPDLLVSECVNAIWKNQRLARISRERALQAVGTIAGLRVELVSSRSLVERAFMLASVLDHAVYDCFYLSLAETRGSDLVTADGAFLRKVADARVTPIRIRHLWETAL